MEGRGVVASLEGGLGNRIIICNIYYKLYWQLPKMLVSWQLPKIPFDFDILALFFNFKNMFHIRNWFGYFNYSLFN